MNSSVLNVNTATVYIPKYNVSGYVFDNSGIGLAGVLVQNGSYQNTTTQLQGYISSPDYQTVPTILVIPSQDSIPGIWK